LAYVHGLWEVQQSSCVFGEVTWRRIKLSTDEGSARRWMEDEIAGPRIVFQEPDTVSRSQIPFSI